MQTTKDCNQQRRRFLRDLATTAPAAAAAATLPLPVSAATDAPEDAGDRRNGKGYQLTQHVIDYYKTAAL